MAVITLPKTQAFHSRRSLFSPGRSLLLLLLLLLLPSLTFCFLMGASKPGKWVTHLVAGLGMQVG
jgi:hypothetical protein